MEESRKTLKVLLVGATGATGSKVLRELLRSNRVGRVVTFTRRPIVLNEGDDITGKLVQVVVPNLEDLAATSSSSSSSSAAAASTVVDGEDCWKGDVIINAIGTTRALAGSGEAFVHIERDLSRIFMARAKSAGSCKRTITISAQSANANSPGPLWFHPLLYAKTLGEKENAALDQNFEENVIFRPGMLDREVPQDQLSWMGHVAQWLPGKLPVSILAKAVMFAVVKENFDSPATYFTGNTEITKIAGEYQADTQPAA